MVSGKFSSLGDVWTGFFPLFAASIVWNACELDEICRKKHFYECYHLTCIRKAKH